jgi:membrane protein YqaA with SNARE-associated domain
MGRIVRWIEATALALGAPGIFIVSLLDSSILSLPEIADLLVIWMVTQRKSLFVLYVVSATLGSLAGCLLLYYIGRKGGDALVRRRFSPAAVEKTMAAFRRYGIMAVLIPSILPPPAPFKVFVLLAGVTAIPVGRFATAVVIGRGARYFVEGLLALWYGERAIEFIRENGKATSLVVVALIAAGFVAYLLLKKSATGAGEQSRI